MPGNAALRYAEDSTCTASGCSLWVELPQAARAGFGHAAGSRASDKYCRDLTRRAEEGELDPVFCREEELDRMVEILCRRQKK